MGYVVSDLFPAGVVLPYAGSTAPLGWLLCDGSEVNRDSYRRLWDTISSTYGSGNGSTTFNLPDLRGRAIAGKDNMGGTAANRLTANLAGTVLGAAGGNENHTLTTGQLPIHAHGQQGTFTSSGHSADHVHGGYTGGITANHYHGVNNHNHGGGAHTHTINTTADGGFNNGRVNEADRASRHTTAVTNSASPIAAEAPGTGHVSNDHAHYITTGGVSSNHTHNSTLSGNTTDVGSSSPHPNIQPTIILNYIIKI
jgi:microcystin-dependent protein